MMRTPRLFQTLLLSCLFGWPTLGLAQSQAEITEARKRILAAGYYRSPLPRIAEDILTWQTAEEKDPAVTKKLITILGWTRRTFFTNQSASLRIIKSAAQQALQSQEPADTEQVQKMAALLNKATAKADEFSRLDAGDFIYIAQVLVGWAHQGNEAARAEILRALESNEFAKVVFMEQALARFSTYDPEWLPAQGEFLTRITRAIGRTWAYSVILAYDLKKKPEKTFRGEPLGATLGREFFRQNLTPAEVAFYIRSEAEHGSYFRLLQSLELLSRKLAPVPNKLEFGVVLADQIKRVCIENPSLRRDLFFANQVLSVAEVFEFHNEFMDQLMADWLVESEWMLPKNLLGLETDEIRYVTKEVRTRAIEQLIAIQQRYLYAQTVNHAASLPPAERAKIGFMFLPKVHQKATPLSDAALYQAFDCQNCAATLKLELLHVHMMDSPRVQDLVIDLVTDAQATEHALDLLNHAISLGPQQAERLRRKLDIRNAYDAGQGLIRYTNLSRQLSQLLPVPGMIQSCLLRLRARYGGKNTAN